jgi:thymidylate synthase (FAD)
LNKSYVGDGNVVLIAGGGKCYTDIAARFVRSERSLEEIISSPYDANIVKNILNSNHKAAVEFDYFIFGIEGYARVTEIQLVRKRIASYMIKTGRANKNGKRNFDVVIPKDIENFTNLYRGFDSDKIIMPNGNTLTQWISDFTNKYPENIKVDLELTSLDLLNFIEDWYNEGVRLGYKEENLRYMKPQATEFKAIIGMNVHALLDWFQIRCCLNAQDEIRDLANKILKLCKNATPDLFQNAGPSCKALGYCPENKLQNINCKKIPTKDEALYRLKNYESQEKAIDEYESEILDLKDKIKELEKQLE